MDVAKRVLDATEQLLRDGHRYTELPVERILEDAEVSRSSFYGHFPDKAALLAQLAERATIEFSAAADKWALEDPAGGPERVEAILAAMLKVYRKHAPVLQALNEVAAYDETVSNLWREGAMRYVEVFAGRISAAQATGHVPSGVDAELTAYVVIHMITSAMADHVAHQPARRDKQLLRTLARAGWLATYGRVPGE